MKETELDYNEPTKNKNSSYLYNRIKAIIDFFTKQNDNFINRNYDSKKESVPTIPNPTFRNELNSFIHKKDITKITQLLEAGYTPTQFQKKLLESISKEFIYSDKILTDNEVKNNLELQTKFNAFVEFKDTNTILQFLESGYIPTKEQQRKLNEITNNLGRELFFDYSTLAQSEVEVKLQTLNKFLNFKFKIPESYLIDFVSNKKENIQNDINSIRIRNIPLMENGISLYPNITQSLSQLLHSEDFYLTLFKSKVNNISRYLHQMEDRFHNRSRSREYLKEHCEYIINNKHIFFTNISFDDFFTCFETLNNHNNSEINNLYAVGMSFYQADVNKLMNKVKSHYSTEYIDVLVKNEAKEQLNLNVLPKDIDSLLKELISNYNEIMDNSNNILNTAEAKVTFESKIPKIIKQYLYLDDDNRYNFYNINGKNAHELTLDSLHQINNLFKGFLNDITENTVNNISALNRATHSLKKV